MLNKRTKLLCICILLLPVLASVFLRFGCFSMPLLDMHDFRQAQAAITVREFLRSGYDPLNYITPVFGSQSRIPFEFPVYQTFCYAVEKATNQFGWFNLDEIGRIVNIGFFLLSAVMLFLLTKQIFKGKYAPYATVLIYMLMPASVFWSRTFMIEFCASFFGLSYGYLFIRYIREQKIWLYLLALSCGILMYLTKATSAMPVVILLAFMILYILIAEQGYFKAGKWRLRASLQRFVAIAVLCLVPVVICFLWNRHADAWKLASGLETLTGKSLQDWNWGTWAQRMNPALWTQALSYIPQGIPPFQLHLLGILLIVSMHCCGNKPLRNGIAEDGSSPYEWRILLLFLFCAISTLFTFFNLYYVHNYYQCAILPFLAAALGAVLAPTLQCIFESRHIGKQILSWSIIGMLVLCMVSSTYVQNYLIDESLNGNPAYHMETMNAALDVKKRSDPDDLIMFAGFDWSSVMPYYSDRHAVMYRPGIFPKEESADFFEQLEEKEPVSLIVLSNTATDYAAIKSYFHLDKPDYKSDSIELYDLRSGR